MRLLRGLVGALLWIVSALLGLVAIILCVTVILLPLGIPLLGYARRLFTLSFKLILPPAASHPFHTAEKSMHKRGRKVKRDLVGSRSDLKSLRKQGRDKWRRARKHVPLAS